MRNKSPKDGLVEITVKVTVPRNGCNGCRFYRNISKDGAHPLLNNFVDLQACDLFEALVPCENKKNSYCRSAVRKKLKNREVEE